MVSGDTSRRPTELISAPSDHLASSHEHFSAHCVWCGGYQRGSHDLRRLYQSRLVGRLLCPIFGDGCEGVADAPFARPFGIPDGYIGAVLYVVILALLFAPPVRWVWIALLVLSAAATLANIV